MSGEFATSVAVRKHRAPTRSAKARLTAAKAGLTSARTALASHIAHLRSRIPSRQEAIDALAELRMPGTWDTEVRMRRLIGVCAWSAALGGVGLFIGARVVFGIFTEMPLWYWFLILVTGIPGVVATFTAFTTLHKDRLPWKLLLFASAAETIALLATLIS